MVYNIIKKDWTLLPNLKLDINDFFGKKGNITFFLQLVFSLRYVIKGLAF